MELSLRAAVRHYRREQIKQGLKLIEERAYKFNPHTVHVTYN